MHDFGEQEGRCAEHIEHLLRNEKKQLTLVVMTFVMRLSNHERTYYVQPVIRLAWVNGMESVSVIYLNLNR